MKNYSKMSDSQINIAVARALGAKIETSSNLTQFYKPDFEASELSPGGPVDKFAPCNSWADAGPIIEQNRISIVEQAQDWCAEGRGIYPIPDKNPRRAAMIVFLMMQEQK